MPEDDAGAEPEQDSQDAMTPEERAANTKVVRGNFINVDRPQYTNVYSNLITRVQAGEK